MKKLEELGISPAPWKCATDDNGEVIGIENARGFYVARFVVDVEPANARLIAAAPKLYEALQSLCEYIDRECVPCGENACELMMSARAALAEAEGEEVEK